MALRLRGSLPKLLELRSGPQLPKVLGCKPPGLFLALMTAGAAGVHEETVTVVGADSVGNFIGDDGSGSSAAATVTANYRARRSAGAKSALQEHSSTDPIDA